jgi:hypothetical protein|tara:strand:- start:24251 stop:24514 length:264 start_codon:yes stop_codon:yes gene_type:complete
MAHVSTRHENASGGRADGASRVKLRKAHALGRHFIQSRCLQGLLAKAPEVPVTEIIGQDEDDIRRATLFDTLGPDQSRGGKGRNEED